MGKKLNRVYQALLEGASEGLTEEKLYQHVMASCPKTSSKRVVKASLLALSDRHVQDRKVLEAIYALAIKYRLASLGVEDDAYEDDDDDPSAPSISEDLKARLATSVAEIPAATGEPPSPSSP